MPGIVGVGLSVIRKGKGPHILTDSTILFHGQDTRAKCNRLSDQKVYLGVHKPCCTYLRDVEQGQGRL